MTADASRRAYTVTRRPAAAGLPAHYVIRYTAGATGGPAVVKHNGAGSLDPRPPREPLDVFAARTGAPVVVNASGWWGDQDTDGDLMGAQITDGKIVKDWEPHGGPLSWVGNYCAAFLADGSFRAYDFRTPVADMLADGVVDTVCQGALVIDGGCPTSFVESSTYAPPSARNVLGADGDGNLHVVLVPGRSGYSGATGRQLADLLAPLNLVTATLADGGGSAQAVVDGRKLVRSSDVLSGLPERRIPQVLTFTAPRVDAPAQWVTVDPSLYRDGWSKGAVRYALTQDRVEVAVLGVEWAGPGPVRVGQPDGRATVCPLPDDLPAPPWSWPELAYLNSRPQESQNARVSAARTVDVSASAPGAVYATFSYPIGG